MKISNINEIPGLGIAWFYYKELWGTSTHYNLKLNTSRNTKYYFLLAFTLEKLRHRKTRLQSLVRLGLEASVFLLVV